jgi:glycosyltransferase involved in cell wall biosynthesis
MKCNIVLDDRSHGGIIEKMASRLSEAVRNLGISCDLSNRHSPNADVNHFMMFHYAAGHAGTKNTMFITHVDDPLKVQILKHKLKIVDVGICMSRMAAKSLMEVGIPKGSLCYITPPHDGAVRPRRIRIGITTHLYDDGRKREALIVRLAKELNLADFHFEIFGLRWQNVVKELRAGNATVNLHEGTGDYQADYAELCKSIPDFDYYLYLGLDEGSLGTLDALAGGVPTIVTEQGFHLDLPGGITYPVLEYAQLRNVFEKIAMERRARINAVAALTWANYAQKHLEIWQALLNGNKMHLAEILGQHQLECLKMPQVGIYRKQIKGISSYLKFTNGMRWNMLKSYCLPRLKRQVWRVMKKRSG